MKKLLATTFIIMCLLTLIACNSNEEGQDILNPYFTGKVIEIQENRCLVEVTDTGNGNFTIDDKVVVNTDIKDCPQFDIGDYLTISFDGKVALSYPPQVLRVFKISKVSK